MSGYEWPDPIRVVEDFYTIHLKLPMSLWDYVQPGLTGSQRPKGPRRQLWSAVLFLGVASLEAGLEEIFFAAHGHRLERTGEPVAREVRKQLVEIPLATPGKAKIDQLLFANFGIELDALKADARFETRRKSWAKGGSSLGTPGRSPSNWEGLGKYLEALMHIRNGSAHGDVVKLARPPTNAEGVLWVKLESGDWSIQQAHALNGLRTVVAVFNAVADALDDELGFFNGASPIRSPAEIFRYAGVR